MQLQNQLKGLLKGNSEFRNTRKGTRVVTKEWEGFSAIRSHFKTNNLLFTSAKDISDGLVDLEFDVIIVKLMPVNRLSPVKGTFAVLFPFILIT